MSLPLPELRQIDHRGKLWRLTKDFTVYDPMGKAHTIKGGEEDGLITDLASVPWLLTWFLGRRSMLIDQRNSCQMQRPQNAIEPSERTVSRIILQRM